MPKRPKSPVIPIAIGVATLAIATALFFHFKESGRDWSGPQGEGAGTINLVELKRDYSNGVLALDISFKNSTSVPVILQPPFARLLAAGDQPVFPYAIDAGSRPAPTIPPGQKMTFRLQYWLEPSHFTSPLDLVIGDQKLPVKSEAPFDIQSIPNQKTKTLTHPAW